MSNLGENYGNMAHYRDQHDDSPLLQAMNDSEAREIALQEEVALLREQRDMLRTVCEAVIKLPTRKGGLRINTPIMNMLMDAVEKCEGAE